MIKKHLKIILMVVGVITLGVFVLPDIVVAEELKVDNSSMVSWVTKGALNFMISWVSYTLLTIVSKFVAISGVFLSLAIKLTINIKDLYTRMPNLEFIWRTVRDISSMFIIFILLFESIKIILGLRGAKFFDIVVKIFIAGMLINFSLFFVKIAIDASNLVSIQFYNAITPGSNYTFGINDSFNDDGLSNVFMQSLKIPKIYGTVKLSSGADIAASITFATVAGIVMMVAAGLSFMAAAFAFTIRTGLLLFIMAVSPLYFAGIIFPEIKRKVSDKIFGLLVSQCVFMPVYLFLTYIALRFLSDEGFMAVFNTSVNGAGDGGFGPILLSTIIQFVIGLIFITAPLIAAIEAGAWGMRWAPNATGMGLNIAKNFGGFIGRKSFGRAGADLGERFDKVATGAQSVPGGKFASSVLRSFGVSQAVRGGLGKMEKSKYGGAKSNADIENEDRNRAKEVNVMTRKSEQVRIIDKVAGKENVPAVDVEAFKRKMREMTSKDVESLGMQRLTDDSVAATLSAKQVETLLKSDSLSQIDKDKFMEARFKGIGGAYLYDNSYVRSQKPSEYEAIMKEDFTKDQKDKIRAARETSYKNLVATEGPKKLLKDILNSDSSEIAKLPVSILKSPDVAVQLTALTLKKILDEKGVNDTDRAEIRGIIEAVDTTKVSDAQLKKTLEKSQIYLRTNAEF